MPPSPCGHRPFFFERVVSMCSVKHSTVSRYRVLTVAVHERHEEKHETQCVSTTWSLRASESSAPNNRKNIVFRVRMRSRSHWVAASRDHGWNRTQCRWFGRSGLHRSFDGRPIAFSPHLIRWCECSRSQPSRNGLKAI